MPHSIPNRYLHCSTRLPTPKEESTLHTPPRRAPWELLSALFCLLFGLALIANIHPVGDGLWFWYATSLLHGQRLYSDLHLSLQPFFPLVTALFLRLLGPSWLAFKVFPALQLLAYVLGLWLIARILPLRPWQRALLLLAVFGMTITTPFYRFDDYHITTQTFELYALGLLLFAIRRPNLAPHHPHALGAALGFLCGLCTGTRLNDGAALFAACFLVLPFVSPRPRFAPLLTLCTVTAATLFATVLLTGDTISAWHLESITLAARIKGGTGSILLTPFSLPVRLARVSFRPKGLVILALTAWLFHRFPLALRRGARLATRIDIYLAAYLTIVFAYWLRQAFHGKPKNAEFGSIGALFLLALGLLALVQVARILFQLTRPSHVQPTRNRYFLLVLIPLFGLLGGALTSGTFLPDYNCQFALFLLILPLVLPTTAVILWQRRTLLMISVLFVLAFIPMKIHVPYQWQYYHSQPMFLRRTLYRHPVYGPMLLEQSQLEFMLALCQTIHADRPGTTLLSTPYPYANYFCNVPPWHKYIQTWYDTSSQQTIDHLDADLDAAPPDWILYQRDLNMFKVHEQALGPGRQVPQRSLDRNLLEKLRLHQWTLTRSICYQGSNWLLLRTNPPPDNQLPQASTPLIQPCTPADLVRWPLG